MDGKEKTRALMTKLTDGIKAIQTSEQFKAMLDMMSMFHGYSYRNCILIAMQCKCATRVAGFNTWKKLGRYVKKGQHGISILAPGTYKRKEVDLETQEEIEETGIYFFPVTVFDISQTEGKELPAIRIESIPDTHGEILANLLELAKECEIEVEFQRDIINDADGVSTGGKIIINDLKNDTEKVLVMVHELAHEVLHQGKEKRKGLTNEQREMEAECIAYVVAKTLGIPETNSEKYLALYHKSYDLKESFQVIHQTSQLILKAIGEKQAVEMAA